ncbi:MAG TPA: aspartate-semialdehyde dehydrogenase [Planctomycetota bacterium]|nr:aspartate-semialdehyde dehydrogenase [Planctomycetota bacterium]
MSHTVAVVGVTGAVGQEMLTCLEERRYPFTDLRLFASPRSAGQKVTHQGKTYTVEALAPGCFKGVNVALFSAGASISREWAPKAVEQGTVVVDNSSAFRYEKEIPLVVPEINPQAAFEHRGIIANPNCTTIIIAVGIYPLHKKAGLKRVVAATYQAASGAGAKAMEELRTQTREVLDGKSVKPGVFPTQIAFNLFPHIDVFVEDDFTKEEMKVTWESRKIMGLPGLNVVTTAVRVPVLRAHSAAVFLEFERPITPAEAREVLKSAPGVKLVDDPKEKLYPTPLRASGQDDVLVGRIRPDKTVQHGLAIFVAGDQLRKGAATNAVQIAELLLKKNR